MEKLFETEEDLFDISARIKSIDENYKIYFNGKRADLNCITAKQNLLFNWFFLLTDSIKGRWTTRLRAR